MSWLEKFTDQVLAKILGYESEPLMALSLYQCGNSSLNMRLKHGSLKEARTPSLMEHLECWPRSLSRFNKLEVVNISGLSVPDKPENIAKSIRLWPASMKEIRLALPNISHAFLQRSVTSSRVPLPGSTEINPEALLTIWKIVDFFPQLEVLQLNDLGTETLVSLRSIDMGVFPRELKVLDWQSARLLHGDFSGLPRRLRTLKLAPQASHSTRVLATLPLALTHLSGVRALNSDAASFMPRTLGDGDWIDKLSVYNMDLAAALPRVKHLSHTMFKLELNDFNRHGMDWSRTLQRSLVTLNIDATLNADQIAALPRSLTSIENISVQEMTIFEYISKNSLEAAKLLWPPKLRTLRFSSNAFPPFQNGDEVTTLPHTLTVLHNIGRGSKDRDSESIYNYMPSWPPHVTDLTIMENEFRRQEIQLGRGAVFPENMIAFRDRHSRLAPDCIYLFPSHMTHLSLASVNFEHHTDYVKALPENLTTFKIGELATTLLASLPKGLTRLSIGFLTGTWNIDEETFNLFPESLTKLSILRTMTVGTIEPEAFESIKPSLVSLKMKRTKVSLPFLNHIPETLTDLRVRPKYVTRNPLTLELFLSFPPRFIPWLAKNYFNKDEVMDMCDAHWPEDIPRIKEIDNYVRRREEVRATLAAAGIDMEGNAIEEAPADGGDDSDSDILDL